MSQTEPLLLDPEEIEALAAALDEGDIIALGLTAEVVMREFAFLRSALTGRFRIRQDGGEWVFTRDGQEVGRIYDVRSRPGAPDPDG
jgi:hypothetical protein